MYAGTDPLTGRELRLVESTTDEGEAHRILNRMRADVEARENARTRATLGAAFRQVAEVHEAGQSTLDGYRGYIRRSTKPALGEETVGMITPQLLEEFYAQLRRCRHGCRDGERAPSGEPTGPT